MTAHVDAALALELLDRAVAEKGADFVYERRALSCRYAHEGKPDCIVGHVLVYLGVPAERLTCIEGMAFDMTILHHVEIEFGLAFTSKAVMALSIAQSEQDSGTPWALAVAEARRAVMQS